MPQPPWRRSIHALAAALTLLSSGCAREGRFSVQNARAHVERLTSGGSRWTGTAANEKARAYVIETLQLYGFDVRVQETDAAWREAGVTTRVANIIATRPGSRPDAVALVAHYDSVAWGPGAGDDAIGTAVALEAARVLAARAQPRYSLMVLITDGEEHGLMGARALVEDPEIRARLKTFLNLEAIGTDSPFPLFETGPGTSPALRAWAGATHPRGGSYMQAIYDALPNDTDFSILKQLPGVSGINFAAAGDGYTYHTDRDRADRVTARVLADAGSVVLDVVDRLDAMPSLDANPTPPMYFSLLDRTAFVWSRRSGVALGWIAAALGLLAWLGIVRRLLRIGGLGRLLLTMAWAVIAAGAVLAALLAAAWLVRASRAELHPWFAAPWRLFTFMTVMVVSVSWLVRRLAAALPERWRPEGTPLGTWFAALPVWVVLLVVALVYAPAASYLVSLPVLAAGLLVAPTLVIGGADAPVRTWPARVGSAAVLVLTWALWAPDLLALLPFVVTLLGRLPIVTPTWVFPAVFFFAGILLWPPVLAVLVGRMRWRVGHGMAGAVIMLAVAVTGILTWLAPAFTAERPQQRSALFLDDRVRGTASWELQGNEPGVDIGPGGPSGVTWQVTARSAAPFGELAPKAFRFRAEVPPPQAPLPASVTAQVVRRVGDADIEITVTPTDAEWQAVGIVLPEAIVPTSSTLAGRTRAGRWQAWHTNVPAAGLTWRATVPASQADRLAGAEVWVSRFRLPGAEPERRIPSWLEAPHTAWMTQHVVVLPVVATDTQAPVEVLGPSVLPLPSANPAAAAPLPTPTTPGSGVPK